MLPVWFFGDGTAGTSLPADDAPDLVQSAAFHHLAGDLHLVADAGHVGARGHLRPFLRGMVPAHEQVAAVVQAVALEQQIRAGDGLLGLEDGLAQVGEIGDIVFQGHL